MSYTCSAFIIFQEVVFYQNIFLNYRVNQKYELTSLNNIENSLEYTHELV